MSIGIGRSLRVAAVVVVMMMMALAVALVDGESLAQRQALYDFYGATNKSSSGGWVSSCSTGGWLTMGGAPPSTFCNGASGSYSTYYGVTCNTPNGNITGLDLRNCNLNGTLTASLIALTALLYLYLNLNQLTGTLPPEWSAMTALQLLHLYLNQLTGTLPPQWSAMTALQELHLEKNLLNGTLPPQWSALTALDELALDSNQLTGTLPPEWSAMTALVVLALYSNQLTGTLPPQWSAMTALQGLDLSSNQLTGTLPPQWSAMTALRGLYLYLNQLTGTLPPQWPQGMQNILSTSPCSVTCSGVVGVNATCSGSAPYSCLEVKLWYNCLDVSSTALPPINSSNPWNWGDSSNMYFGPQRNDCPTVVSHATRSASLPSHSTSETIAGSGSGSVTPTTEDSVTLSHSAASMSVTAGSASPESVSATYSAMSSTGAQSISVSVSTTNSVTSRSAFVFLSQSVSITEASNSRTGTVLWTGSVSRSVETRMSVSASACGAPPIRGVWSRWNGTTRRPDGGYDAVEPDAVQWKDGAHTAASVDVHALLGRRCLTLVVRLAEGESAGWTVANGTGEPAVWVQGEAWVTGDMDNRTVVLSGERNATVWLCTTKAEGMWLDGRQSSSQLRVGVGALCSAGRQRLPPAAGPSLSLRLTNDAAPAPRTELSLAVVESQTALSRGVARVVPTLQRMGGGACGADGPSGGLWALDVGDAHDARAQHVGAVVGNVLFVAVAWGALSVCGVCVARWWHGPGDDEAAGPRSLLAAVRRAHVATLWAPLMAMVVVPVTANSVALVRQGDAGGVAGLAVVAAHVAALTWVCATARSRLRVEAVLPRTADAAAVGPQPPSPLVQQLALYLRGLVQEHWAAGEGAVGVAFKRHAQAVLSQATAWWYCPLEAALGVAVGVADGAGSCAWSVAVGVAAQLALAAVVAWRRPHGELIGHWSTLGTSLASGAAMLVTAAAPSSAAAAVASFSLTTVATGLSLGPLAATLLSVVLWTLQPTAWRGRPSAAAQPSAAVEDRRSVSPSDTSAERDRCEGTERTSSSSSELPSEADSEVRRVPSPCPTTDSDGGDVGRRAAVMVNPLIGVYDGHSPPLPPPPQRAASVDRLPKQRGHDPQRGRRSTTTTTGRRAASSSAKSKTSYR